MIFKLERQLTELRTQASSSTAGSVATAVGDTRLLCGTMLPALRTINMSPTCVCVNLNENH